MTYQINGSSQNTPTSQSQTAASSQIASLTGLLSSLSSSSLSAGNNGNLLMMLLPLLSQLLQQIQGNQQHNSGNSNQNSSGSQTTSSQNSGDTQNSSTSHQNYTGTSASTTTDNSAPQPISAPNIPAPSKDSPPYIALPVDTRKGFGDQTNVSTSFANGQLTLNGSATYSSEFLTQAFEEFRNSEKYPNLQTRDLVATKWGYQGSSSALTAFYNYLGQQYPQGESSTSTTTTATNQAASYATSTSTNTTTSVGGTSASGSYATSDQTSTPTPGQYVASDPAPTPAPVQYAASEPAPIPTPGKYTASHSASSSAPGRYTTSSQAPISEPERYTAPAETPAQAPAQTPVETPTQAPAPSDNYPTKQLYVDGWPIEVKFTPDFKVNARTGPEGLRRTENYFYKKLSSGLIDGAAVKLREGWAIKEIRPAGTALLEKNGETMLVHMVRNGRVTMPNPVIDISVSDLKPNERIVKDRDGSPFIVTIADNFRALSPSGKRVLENQTIRLGGNATAKAKSGWTLVAMDQFGRGGWNNLWTKDGKTARVSSPIAFDLNGDGKIGTTGVTTAVDRDINTKLGTTVTFDLDGDGKLEATEWMNGDGDALLVDTSKIGDNNAIDGNALFGDQGGKFDNGYEKLSLHDANADGKLEGSELNNLALWVDDGDAILEEGELKQIEEYGLTEISTQKQDVKNERGETLMQSSATANGQFMLTEDVWFGQK